MISWIQRNLQHHFRAIFAVILAGTIISFVVTIGATPGVGRGDRHAPTQLFFGYNLSSPDDQQRLFGDASFSVYLRYGFSGISGPQLENYAFQRAATLALANQLHIPSPSSTTLADYVKTLGAFHGPNGEFDAKLYNSFLTEQGWSKIDPRLTANDVSRIMSDDWRASQMDKLLSGPGYVLADDIKKQLVYAETQWTVNFASVDYASYSPSISVSPADVAKFFDQNAFRYEVPAHVSLSYVEFPAAAFINQVNLSDADIRAYYDANPARFPKPASAKTPVASLKTDPDADFATVRTQVEITLKLERASRLAAQAASDFAVALYNGKITGFSPEFDALLASQHLTLKSLPPFAADTPPAELGTSPDLADQVSRLGQDHFYSDAIGTPAGSAILFWKDTIPSHKPLLAEVQAQVTADCKEAQRLSSFVNEFGKNIHDQLAARLKAGDSFDKAVAAVDAAAGIKLDLKKPASFSQRQPPKDIDNAVLGNIDRLPVGQVSPMISAQGKGYFVYVAAKKLPDLAESGPQFADTRSQLAAFTSRITLGSTLQEIISKEQEKSAPADKP